MRLKGGRKTVLKPFTNGMTETLVERENTQELTARKEGISNKLSNRKAPNLD